jgi:hypothetical protein
MIYLNNMYSPLSFIENGEINNNVVGILSNESTVYPSSNLLVYESTEESYKISKTNSSIFSFMAVFTSTYLLCETLQASNFIEQHDHSQITQNTYAYNLLFVWLITYFFLHFSNISAQKKPNILLYWVFCCIGGLGFALLGEISFLKNIKIVKNWWEYISFAAWGVIVFFTSIISYLCLHECFFSIRNMRWCKNVAKILSVLLLYFFILFLLINGNSKNIVYHVHHAIFAGILSLWFVNWKYKPAMFMHAILMGVIIEGICFYGINEFFLFIVGDSPVPFDIVLIISIIFLIPLLATMNWVY